MNKRLSKLFATLLVTAIVLSAFPILMPAKAVFPPAFYIIPDQSFVSPPTTVGTTFTETLYISTSGPTFTYQFEVDYNSAQLNCTSAVYTAPPTSQFFAGHTSVPTLALAPGVVSGGETLLGTDSVPATPGGASIITMTFKIMQNPPFNGNLTSLISPNPANCFLLDPDLNTVTGVSFGPATYLNTWAAPPKPYFEVDASQTVFLGNVVQNGTTFTATIVIKNAAGWFADNASVELDYNSALIYVSGWVLDPAWSSATITNNTGALLITNAIAVSPLTGDTNLIVVTFTIWNQGASPPLGIRTPGDFDVSPLTLVNPQLGSQAGFYITLAASVNSSIKVYVYSQSAPPFLSVECPGTIGPGAVNGTLFNVTVTFNNVADFENIIGIQFRLGFDSTMIYPVAVYEGPFLPSYAALQPGSLGTFFTYFIEVPDGVYGPHVLVGNMIFPNGTGSWNPPMLNGTGVIATITFQVINQSFGEPNFVSPLNIVDQEAIALDNLITQNIVTYPLGDPINCSITINNSFPNERMIDEYGGAVNSYMIPLVGAPYLQFPAPYGGQGPNMQMDMVEPQSWVWLHANVTYNFWPVQFKNVAFEVDMPNGTVYTKLSAFTDVNGVATVGFRMPWPCDINTTSHNLIGVWTETSTVQLADITINDTLSWHYDYLVNIWKVTTDMFQYTHGQCVQVTFTYGSHASQSYPVLFFVQIVDNLGVTVGIAEVQTTISGATDCTYNNGTATVEICIPKWAYAGIATVIVNAFNTEPSLGGVALGPEYVGPTIAIQPY